MALGWEGACSDKEEEVRVVGEGLRGQALPLHTHILSYYCGKRCRQDGGTVDVILEAACSE